MNAIDRDQAYDLNGLVELDDAYVGGRKSGKRGRGAEGKKPVLFAVDRRDQGMGFMAAQSSERVSSEAVCRIAQRLSPDAVIRTDAFTSMATSRKRRHRIKLTNGCLRFTS